MCFLFRKMFIAAVLAVTGLVIAHKAGLTSYGATAYQKIRGAVKNQVPLEFEVERLRYQIAELVPDMKRHLSDIAEEMVATQNLRDDIQVTRDNLKKQKDSILAMTRDLAGNTATVSYGGRDYSASRIREKLSHDFRSYQTCEAELKSKEKLLDAKERALDAAKEQLATIRTQKQDLELQVEQIEADLKQVRLSQAQNKIQIDDSALAQCKKTLADIQNRLKVEKKTAELSGDFANDNTIPVELRTKSTAELQKDIQTYFGERFADEGKVVERK
jgi:chromosome segregation ATPase